MHGKMPNDTTTAVNVDENVAATVAAAGITLNILVTYSAAPLTESATTVCPAFSFVSRYCKRSWKPKKKNERQSVTALTSTKSSNTN